MKTFCFYIILFLYFLVSCNNKNDSKDEYELMFDYFGAFFLVKDDSIDYYLARNTHQLSENMNHICARFKREGVDSAVIQARLFDNNEHYTKFISGNNEIDSLSKNFVFESIKFIIENKEFNFEGFHHISESYLENLRSWGYIDAMEYASYSIIIRKSLRNSD